MTSKLRLRNQEIAEMCLKKIKEIKKDAKGNNEKLDKYLTAIRRLPSTIVSNGLISAMAFYKSKEKEKKEIYQIISKLLKEQKLLNFKENEDLLDFLVRIDANTLRFVSSQVLLIATWLKRIAEVELREEE